MFEDALIKYRQVRRAAPDIDNRHTRLQVVFTHDRGSGGQGLEDQVLGAQSRLVHAAVDVADGVLVPGDDVEISTHLHPAVSYRVRDVLEIIHGELLGDHVDDLVPGGDIGFILVIDQLV